MAVDTSRLTNLRCYLPTIFFFFLLFYFANENVSWPISTRQLFCYMAELHSCALAVNVRLRYCTLGYRFHNVNSVERTVYVSTRRAYSQDRTSCHFQKTRPSAEVLLPIPNIFLLTLPSPRTFASFLNIFIC